VEPERAYAASMAHPTASCCAGRVGRDHRHQLVHAEDGVGRPAGGIANTTSNLLAIARSVELLQDDLSLRRPARVDLRNGH
jgi:hypothetical protein